MTFLAYLHKKGLSFSAINVYLSAVRNLNIINGFSVPLCRSPRIKLALKCIKDMSKEPARKEPITLQLLKDLWPVIVDSQDSLMWQSLISLAFYGSMRCSEYTPGPVGTHFPAIQNITFSHNGQYMYYKVPKCKTLSNGFTCTLACSGSVICALCCTVTYLQHRVTSGQVSAGSPLFVTASGKQVCSKQVNTYIKQIVSALGFQATKYSAHSLRAGAASTAARAGFRDWEIKLLGGWKSSTYTQYIRDNNKHAANFSRRMANAVSH